LTDLHTLTLTHSSLPLLDPDRKNAGSLLYKQFFKKKRKKTFVKKQGTEDEYWEVICPGPVKLPVSSPPHTSTGLHRCEYLFLRMGGGGRGAQHCFLGCAGCWSGPPLQHWLGASSTAGS